MCFVLSALDETPLFLAGACHGILVTVAVFRVFLQRLHCVAFLILLLLNFSSVAVQVSRIQHLLSFPLQIPELLLIMCQHRL
jgi:hypothetical protein